MPIRLQVLSARPTSMNRTGGKMTYVLPVRVCGTSTISGRCLG
jgi:hypothetical protein